MEGLAQVKAAPRFCTYRVWPKPAFAQPLSDATLSRLTSVIAHLAPNGRACSDLGHGGRHDPPAAKALERVARSTGSDASHGTRS